MRRLLFSILMMLSISIGTSQSNDIESLALQLAFQDQDSLKVDISLKLIESLYDINAYDRAFKYILASEKLCQKLDHKKGIANMVYYKALIYAQKNDYINAISGYEKSKQLFEGLKDTLGIAKVNNSIGLIEIKRGHFSKGMSFSHSAIRELEKRHLKAELNLAYSNLAQAYNSIGATDKAIEFYIKTLEVQESLNDEQAIYKTKNTLAELYASRKEHRKAIEIYENIIDNHSSNDSILGHIYPRISAEYLEFNDYEKASKYLNEAYAINTTKENKEDLLITLNNLGDLNLRQNRLSEADTHLTEARNTAETTTNKFELLKLYKLLIALDSTRNRFTKAFEWQRAYYELNAKLNEEKAIQKERLYKPLSHIEHEPHSLVENISSPEVVVNMLSETKENTDRLKMSLYSVVGALVLVSIFLVFSYLKRNSNIKYTQELEEKNLSIALQNEAFSQQTKHLESVNNVKDKLFSIVSHDLRDSLSSINGFIDLLKDGSLSREEFDNLIPELSENANNASLLLFNLLNWSKSQMQSLDPKPTLFDVQEVFNSKIKLIEQRLENKGITLINRSIKNFAYADKSMIEIVIQNLLANALKFCKKGDTITITNHINNGCCIISIADSGVGISKENLSKLFKESSFSTLGTDNEKGTGLGLSICKELIDLNHGKIWVESTPQIGSTFFVQLPKSQPV
ncbi:ATP-binding protein [Tamlana sp. s12]|uniref:tetratricopeptide repeat-containing sensor histidine kinase n=1 Tax=Tamlana sp. s12 TaxID=1630406 RepID=UPI0007FD55CD|nr:ATP-binding protein [Tamlana sp. s12]OBQ55981.1 ATP-binding protein [Tamlana sp. s12]